MAYSKPFNPLTPLGSENLNTADDYLRDTKAAATERLDDIFGTSGGSSFSAADPYKPFLIKLSGSATSKILPGATSLSLRNAADSADNILVTDSGSVTIRREIVTGAFLSTFNGGLDSNNRITVNSGGFVVTSGGAVITGATSVTGTFSASGLTTLSAGLIISGNGFSVTGNSALTGNLSITGSLSVTGTITGTFTLTNSTFSGVSTFSGNVVYSEVNKGSAGAGLNVDWSGGNHQKVDINSNVNVSITFTNPLQGSRYLLRLNFTTAYSNTITLTTLISGTKSHYRTDLNNTNTTLVFSNALSQLTYSANNAASGQITIIELFYTGTEYVVMNLVKLA